MRRFHELHAQPLAAVERANERERARERESARERERERKRKRERERERERPCFLMRLSTSGLE